MSAVGRGAGRVTSRGSGAGVASPVARRAALVVIGLVFAVPIAAMVAFSLRSADGTGHDLGHWLALADPENGRAYRNLVEGITNSLVLAVVTAVLVLVMLVPAMVLVHLRYPRLSRALEFVCLVPITVPAIVLVVGLAPVYSVVARLLGSGAWTLALAYGVTVLPYAYRAVQSDLAATDLRTLTEASRTLGSSWLSTLVLVVVPSLRRGLLAAPSSPSPSSSASTRSRRCSTGPPSRRLSSRSAAATRSPPSSSRCSRWPSPSCCSW